MAEFLSFLINLEIAGFVVPNNLSLKLNVMSVIHSSNFLSYKLHNGLVEKSGFVQLNAWATFYDGRNDWTVNTLVQVLFATGRGADWPRLYMIFC